MHTACIKNANKRFVKEIQRGYTDVESAGCLSRSVKLLLSAVQGHFEMEILRRRSELGGNGEM